MSVGTQSFSVQLFNKLSEAISDGGHWWLKVHYNDIEKNDQHRQQIMSDFQRYFDANEKSIIQIMAGSDEDRALKAIFSDFVTFRTNRFKEMKRRYEEFTAKTDEIRRQNAEERRRHELQKAKEVDEKEAARRNAMTPEERRSEDWSKRIETGLIAILQISVFGLFGFLGWVYFFG